MEGQYRFYLAFALRKAGTEEVLAEARGFENSDRRSVNCELYLEPGTYEVLPKITAERRHSGKSIDEVLRTNADKNPRKLQQVGRQYDLAHGRAGVLDEDAEQERKKLEEKKKRKQKKVQKPKPDKMREMRDAMAKMQMAMTNMQSELSKKTTCEDSGNQTDIQSLEDNGPRMAGGEGISKGNKRPAKIGSTRPSPGLWPGCSFEAKEQPSKRLQELVQPESQPNNLTVAADSNSSSNKDAPDRSADTEPQAPKPGPGNSPGLAPTPPGPPPPPAENKDSSSDSDSDSDSSSDSSASESDAGTYPGPGSRANPRWNPVCVTCLRVYAQDQEISIKLVKGENSALPAAARPGSTQLCLDKSETTRGGNAFD